MSLTWIALYWALIACVFCGSCGPFCGSCGQRCCSLWPVLWLLWPVLWLFMAHAVAFVASSVALVASVVVLCGLCCGSCSLCCGSSGPCCGSHGLCHQQPYNSPKAFLPVALSHWVSAPQRLLGSIQHRPIDIFSGLLYTALCSQFG